MNPSNTKVISEKQKRELLAQVFTESGYGNWRKCPSVTTGGKPFFWVRFVPSVVTGRQMRESIVWDRTLKAWTFSRA